MDVTDNSRKHTFNTKSEKQKTNERKMESEKMFKYFIRKVQMLQEH